MDNTKNNSAPLTPEKDLKTFYEKYYPRGSGITSIPKDNDFMYGMVLKQIRPYLTPGLKVLDVGCNDGNLSLYMALAGCKVFGVDIASNAIEMAIKSAEYYKITNARFQCVDFIKDWEPKPLFDLAVCINVIEHIPDDKFFLDKIVKSLKPAGHLIISTATVNSPIYRISKAIWGKFEFDVRAGHLRRYSPKDFVRLCALAGLNVDKICFFDSIFREMIFLVEPFRKFHPILSKKYIQTIFNGIDNFFAKLSFAGLICVHGKRKD